MNHPVVPLNGTKFDISNGPREIAGARETNYSAVSDRNAAPDTQAKGLAQEGHTMLYMHNSL